jgi:hypothetical protein
MIMWCGEKKNKIKNKNTCWLLASSPLHFAERADELLARGTLCGLLVGALLEEFDQVLRVRQADRA